VPFAPVHLRARRNPVGGDIDLAWIRRTRFGGVPLERIEVPLNEVSEAYRIEIHDGGGPVRTAETDSPAYSYPAAEQSADFGGPAPAFTFKVMQLSAAVGAGRALEAIVDV
jgi:hypothetical protein